ncbi:ABC transporter permease [Kitasatospora sp. NPDC089913]|uniref:ABC transporter permease n=1 Tax=Streptomycetaceae TaxID=2062 RepID=UPI00087C67F2|nr:MULTISPECIES: ABC transporter permease [Streptomycetaceae]MCX4687536.1 ABC transporter permease [Kitasatospora purpeofusca]MCX4754686.1 ABC transporter permease [Kitasatospora purpeofusca]WSR34090.1 ABC transporter permease [Kitasatospora purpeofusca]SDT64216.1 peptide/nickel transport system permease protein/oligopeptide transport system permease protein [Streptomyces sp. TLI_053]BEK67965.1 ABC transporter permease [Kitasatospora purpeofusca]
MGRYVIRRLIQAIPVLIGATFLIYWLCFSLPGDPVQALAGEKKADPIVAEMIRQKYHLNDPFLLQYWNYITGVFQGNLGESLTGRQVSDMISEAFPFTVNLAIVAFVIEAIIGVLAGVMAALRKGKFLDQLVLISTLFVISIPVFVTGFVLQLVLGVKLKNDYGIEIFSVSFNEEDGLRGYLLPAFVLASTSLAYVARLTRTSLMETMRADYVRTAVAKGLKKRRVIGRHALRNALIPIVTFLGADLGGLMGGAVITEKIFNIHGIGGLLAQAVYQKQGTIIVGVVTLLVMIYLVTTLLVDMLYAVLDPRIRYE